LYVCLLLILSNKPDLNQETRFTIIILKIQTYCKGSLSKPLSIEFLRGLVKCTWLIPLNSKPMYPLIPPFYCQKVHLALSKMFISDLGIKLISPHYQVNSAHTGTHFVLEKCVIATSVLSSYLWYLFFFKRILLLAENTLVPTVLS